MQAIQIETMKNVDRYMHTLGNFWHNFNSLEFILRLYLNRKDGYDNEYAMELLWGPVGIEREENNITNWKSFKELCNEFNKYQNEASRIDFDEIIKLRDAMAHGRVLGDANGNMKVIKYSKPKNGKVTVEYFKVLNPEELNKIIDYIGILGPEITKRR